MRIDEAVARAAADGMPALAITDLANVFGMVKFYKAARAAGVKPIIGCDVWITNESERDKPHRLLLLTQSRAGYLRLSELLTRAWLENQHRGRAELMKSWFAEGTDGLIALSGATQGDVGAALLQDPVRAEQLAADWSRLFPGRYYLELQRAGAPHAEAYVEAAVRLAGSCSLPVVATHPVQFLRSSSPICPRRSPTPSRSRAAATSPSSWGNRGCRFSQLRRACHARNFFAGRPKTGLSGGSLRITEAERTKSGRRSTRLDSKSSCEPSSRWDSPATS